MTMDQIDYILGPPDHVRTAAELRAVEICKTYQRYFANDPLTTPFCCAEANRIEGYHDFCACGRHGRHLRAAQTELAHSETEIMADAA